MGIGSRDGGQTESLHEGMVPFIRVQSHKVKAWLVLSKYKSFLLLDWQLPCLSKVWLSLYLRNFYNIPAQILFVNSVRKLSHHEFKQEKNLALARLQRHSSFWIRDVNLSGNLASKLISFTSILSSRDLHVILDV